MIEQFKHYIAEVNIREDIGKPVKEECKSMNGDTVKVEAGWIIDSVPYYEGEWAMLLHSGKYPITWIAEGDLINIRED